MIKHRNLSLLNIYNSNISNRNLLSISNQDYKKHPELHTIVNNRKQYSLSYISNTNPQMRPTKEINDYRKKKMISNLNSFHQMFFDYCKNES